ncbi:MAG TPA: tRNA lysidine(34) synthetase TilS [Caulobacteraceae bacterium]
MSAVLDRRLDRNLAQPIAVAFSGGGDSLAALIATKAWADGCGRPVIAFHVDHQLQAASAAWRDFAADAAHRLGVGFRALAWIGEKPGHGLAAAARRARHGLIAEAARAAGATTVVFGHTADDIAESALMRAQGSSLGPPREWRPSPVWPEGRGVFILRPLLAVRRAAIRAALRASGWGWIDDPANEDPRQPRARARRQLVGATNGPTPLVDDLDTALAAAVATFDDWGTIRLDRASLRRTPGAPGRRMLAAAMLCVGGGERPPRAERVGALFDRLAGLEDFTATLAGASLVAGPEVLIARNGGEIVRGGLAPVALEPGRATVWDGRFELRADRPGLGVIALRGAQARLDAATRRRLKAAPAAARPALPLVVDAGGGLACPMLADDDAIVVHSLVGARFSAACGAVSKEPRA